MMVATAYSRDLLSNSGIPSNTLNFLHNAKGEIIEKVEQAAGTITETARRVKATLPGATDTVIKHVADTGNQVIGKGAETVGSAKAVIIDSAEKTLNATVYNWMDTHPLISWFLTHPLYTIGVVLLTLLLLSGLLRAVGRITEKVWLFILHSPFKLGKWLLGLGTKTFITGSTTSSSKNTSQARLAEILSRLEAIRKEQDSLMHEVEAILTLENK
jgi:hypothetical protein